MLLHKLGHIKPYHCALIAEKRCGKSFAKLCFTYACRAEEDERACRSVRVFESDSATADSLCNCRNSLILTDDSSVKLLLHVEKSLAFLFCKLNNRNMRPLGNNGGNFVGSYNAVCFRILLFPALLCVFKVSLDLFFLVTQGSRLFKVLTVDSRSLFFVYALDFLLKLSDILGRSVGTQANL